MTHRNLRPLRPLFCLLALFLLAGPSRLLAAGAAADPAAQERRLGERMYREGILPSGEKLRVVLKGDAPVPGLTFSCASCHLRSGLGAFDEGVYTPAINGEKLFQPLERLYKGVKVSEGGSDGPLRPAYTEETLAEALRTGRAPGGRLLSEVMPRYQFEEKDVKLLASYLRTLSTTYSPGVTETGIRFATVISEDVRIDQREAMLSALAYYFNMKNSQIRGFSNPRSGAKSRLMAENMLVSRELTHKTISLSRWILKGPRETWKSQLEEYNRKEPVFALLGGIVTGSWEPVHRFAEEHEIPCLYPNTEFPVISDSSWYTLYQSKGYFQEGEGAARYLAERDELLKGGPVLQLVREGAEGRALAAGFQQTWQELGQQAPRTVTLPPGEPLDRARLEQLVSREKPAVLLVWDAPAALAALESLGKQPGRPGLVLVSARYLGDAIWTLPEGIRDFTYITYPYAFSVKVKQGMMKQVIQDDQKPTLKKAELPVKTELQKLTGQTNALTQLLTGLLVDLKGNYYRDNLLDVAGMMADQAHPLYGRVSFGTGHRYAARGCFVVQLSKGATPELVKKSAWLVH